MSDAAHKMPTAFDVDPDPTTILSLSDDTTMLILSHAGFASLLALKLVSRCFSVRMLKLVLDTPFYLDQLVKDLLDVFVDTMQIIVNIMNLIAELSL